MDTYEFYEEIPEKPSEVYTSLSIKSIALSDIEPSSSGNTYDFFFIL